VTNEGKYIKDRGHRYPKHTYVLVDEEQNYADDTHLRLQFNWK
jgi:hypothetical protein